MRRRIRLELSLKVLSALASKALSEEDDTAPEFSKESESDDEEDKDEEPVFKKSALAKTASKKSKDLLPFRLCSSRSSTSTDTSDHYLRSPIPTSNIWKAKHPSSTIRKR